jgi:hypothetical protein
MRRCIHVTKHEDPLRVAKHEDLQKKKKSPALDQQHTTCLKMFKEF